MTTDLEKQFFDTFGIEPKFDCKRCGAMNFALGQCAEVDCEKTYPYITDRILLEFICILSEWRTYLHSSYTIKADNTLNLKQDVLKDFLELFKWYEFKKCENGIKQQVQALFKEW